MTMPELEARIEKLEAGLAAVQEKLKNVTGSPVISAYHGARLDLNDDIDALAINQRLGTVNSGARGSRPVV
jgi:hypothetical protein